MNSVQSVSKKAGVGRSAKNKEWRWGDMSFRILGVMGTLLVSVLTHSVGTGGVAHAQEQSPPTLLNSDARLQVEIAFWQAIEDSEDYRDFKDYLEQFPDGQFVTLAHRRLQARVANHGTALLDQTDGEIVTAVNLAASGNDVDVLEWLKAQGADINARGFSDQTPMHSAAQGNAVASMEWLKAQGADINVRASDGQTPMHSAVWGNAVASMEWLNAQGADINARDSSDREPIHLAAQGNAVAAMEWL